MGLYKLINKKRKQNKRKLVRNLTISTVVGGTAGVLSGILLAPKSGKETREDIKGKALEVKEETTEKAKELKRNVKEAKSKIKDYLNEKNKKEDSAVDENIVCEDENAEA